MRAGVLFRLLGAVTAVAALLLLARALGAPAFGVWVTALSSCLVLSRVASLVVPRAALRFLAGWRGRLLHEELRGRVGPAPRRATRAWVAASAPVVLLALFADQLFAWGALSLSAMMPARDIGVLGAACCVALLPGLAAAVVDRACLPRLLELHRSTLDRRGMQAELTRGTRLGTAAAGLGFLVVVAAGRPLLGLLGEAYAGGYAAMLVLALSLVVRAAIGPAPELLALSGRASAGRAAGLVGLVSVPLVSAWLVPALGVIGGALSILAATVLGGLWLHRVLWRRTGLSASLLGGRKRTINDVRRGRVESCGPEVVVKCFGLYVGEEYEKARALQELFSGGRCISPAPLKVHGPRIEYEYVPYRATLKDAYVDYVTAEDASGHPMPRLIESAAEMVARLHTGLGTPAVETWRPSPSFVRDLEARGYGTGELEAAPHVPLHLDFCMQNIGYRDGGELVLLDPSPDFLSTFHPHTHGPAYYDLGLLLSNLEGRMSPLKYPRVRWERVRDLKARFVSTYNRHAAEPVDPGLAGAVGYCLARRFFRAKYHVDTLARAATWLLYRADRADAREAGHDRGATAQRV